MNSELQIIGRETAKLHGPHQISLVRGVIKSQWENTESDGMDLAPQHIFKLTYHGQHRAPDGWGESDFYDGLVV